MAVADEVQRRYALIKLEAGDYILPSNDKKIIWRISQYEDGPSLGLEDWPRDKKVWGLWRWTDPDIERIRFDDFDGWEMQASTLPTRQAAIDEAMRMSGD